MTVLPHVAWSVSLAKERNAIRFPQMTFQIVGIPNTQVPAVTIGHNPNAPRHDRVVESSRSVSHTAYIDDVFAFFHLTSTVRQRQPEVLLAFPADLLHSFEVRPKSELDLTHAERRAVSGGNLLFIEHDVILAHLKDDRTFRICEHAGDNSSLRRIFTDLHRAFIDGKPRSGWDEHVRESRAAGYGYKTPNVEFYDERPDRSGSNEYAHCSDRVLYRARLSPDGMMIKFFFQWFGDKVIADKPVGTMHIKNFTFEPATEVRQHLGMTSYWGIKPTDPVYHGSTLAVHLKNGGMLAYWPCGAKPDELRTIERRLNDTLLVRHAPPSAPRPDDAHSSQARPTRKSRADYDPI